MRGTGAFYTDDIYGYLGNDSFSNICDPEQWGSYVHFSAQKYNSVYGSSNTVQPSALDVKMLIKY